MKFLRELGRFFLRFILQSKQAPLWMLIAIIITGISLVFAIKDVPSLAITAIILGTFITVMGILVIIYISYDGKVRLSPMVQQRFYEYDSIRTKTEWEILDPEGQRSVLRQNRTIKFRQNDVMVIREYVWGDSYYNGTRPQIDDFYVKPGTILDIYREGGRFVILIALDKTYNDGEELDYHFERKELNAFTRNKEWVEFQPFTNSKYDEIVVTLPDERKIKKVIARFRHGDYSQVYELGENNFLFEILENKQRISWKIQNAIPRSSYFVEWEW
jgi:hypothetical protein